MGVYGCCVTCGPCFSQWLSRTLLTRRLPFPLSGTLWLPNCQARNYWQNTLTVRPVLNNITLSTGITYVLLLSLLHLHAIRLFALLRAAITLLLVTVDRNARQECVQPDSQPHFHKHGPGHHYDRPPRAVPVHFWCVLRTSVCCLLSAVML
jgi:hypothetical protein